VSVDFAPPVPPPFNPALTVLARAWRAALLIGDPDKTRIVAVEYIAALENEMISGAGHLGNAVRDVDRLTAELKECGIQLAHRDRTIAQLREIIHNGGK
jgi:hypothetical protein